MARFEIASIRGVARTVRPVRLPHAACTLFALTDLVEQEFQEHAGLTCVQALDDGIVVYEATRPGVCLRCFGSGWSEELDGADDTSCMPCPACRGPHATRGER
jgi:hypothetical protein